MTPQSCFHRAPRASLTVALAIASLASVHGASWYVSTNGVDEAGNGTAESPFASVQYAINSAEPGDEIKVGPGTFGAISISTSELTIRGGYDDSWNFDPANAVSAIYGWGAHAVTFNSGSTSNRLSHLALTTGRSANGIQLANSAQYLHLFFDSCSVTNCRDGVYIGNSCAPELEFRSCLIANNSDWGCRNDYNGGPGGWQAFAKILNCTVANNGAGGWYEHGANRQWPGIVPIAKNTIFANNGGPGLDRGSASYTAEAKNCLFFGNAGGSLRGNGIEVEGCASNLDPLFADPANGNFRLLPGSPAIGTGLDLSAEGVGDDIDGVNRGASWSIGAFAAQGTAANYPSRSETFVDPASGFDTDASDGSRGQPYASIGFALGRTAAGGTVHVAWGNYEERIDLGPDKGIVTIDGGLDPATWLYSTNGLSVVDGKGNSPLSLSFSATNCIVKGLSLVGGGSNPGVGLHGPASGLTLEKCRIYGNSHGVYSPQLMPQDVTLANCAVYANGFGMWFGYQCTSYARAYNCVFHGNTESGFHSDGVWNDCAPTFVNCIFTGNGKYGIRKEGNTTGGSVSYSLFHGNGTDDISAPTFTTGDGVVIGQNPGFADPGQGDFSVRGDSPAVASGTDLSGNDPNGRPVNMADDLAGAPRPQNGWDMGVYESDGSGASASLLSIAYVSASGSDTDGDGSASSPWATIAHALAYTEPDATIYMAGGSYDESVTIPGTKRGMRISGGYNPSTWAWDPIVHPTTIRGVGGVSPLSFAPGANSNSVHSLHLTGGTNNGEGGISLRGILPVISVEQCTLSGNAIGFYSPNLFAQDITMRDSLFVGNASHGAYLGWQAYSTLDAVNCTFAGNGGDGFISAGCWQDCNASFRNCIFANNAGFGIDKGGNQPMRVEYCAFAENGRGCVFVAQNTATFGEGNKYHRPILFADIANGDYHLLNGSPAACAGTNLAAVAGCGIDADGLQRSADPHWSMGAFEYGADGDTPPIPEDPTDIRPVTYVAQDGVDDVAAGRGTVSSPFATVNYALGFTQTNGLVCVAAGTYGKVDVPPQAKDIEIRGGFARAGTDGSQWTHAPDRAATFIDGAGDSAVRIGAAASGVRLANLRLFGATQSLNVSSIPFGGAGVEYGGQGAGLLTVDGCVIMGNLYGIYNPNVLFQSTDIRNSVIAENTRYGVYFGWQQTSFVKLLNCTVANNGLGGYMAYGVWNDACPTILNCIFCGNGGIAVEKQGGTAGGAIDYCIFHGNTGADSSIANPGTVTIGENLLDGDPMLSVTEDGIHAEAPYSIADEASSAYNAGADLSLEYGLATDVFGMPRPQSRVWDIGAYEACFHRGTLFILK